MPTLLPCESMRLLPTKIQRHCGARSHHIGNWSVAARQRCHLACASKAPKRTICHRCRALSGHVATTAANWFRCLGGKFAQVALCSAASGRTDLWFASNCRHHGPAVAFVGLRKGLPRFVRTARHKRLFGLFVGSFRNCISRAMELGRTRLS